MIDVIAQTPIEYSKQSRDYQYIARLYTVLFNFNKMYIDDMSVWDADIDNKLSYLRAKTLNFHPKHAWQYDVLDAATSCLKDLVKRKGTKEAIRDVVTILERANNLRGEPQIEVDYNTYTIIIKIPKQLASMGVVDDLLELIIPIGMGYRIVEYEQVDAFVEDEFYIDDRIDIKKNIKIIPTYKMGIGGPKINSEPKYVDDFPSLHVGPGVVTAGPGESGKIETVDESIWPDDTNTNQGTMVHYEIATTMGEVRDSHEPTDPIGRKGDEIIYDGTEDTNDEDVTWKGKKKK